MRMFLSLALCVSPSFAAADSSRVAYELGHLLGMERTCGLELNPVAVRAYINARVPAEDLSFAPALEMMAAAGRNKADRSTGAERDVQCALALRSADALGLLVK